MEGVRRAPEFADDVALLLLVLPETLFRAGASGISQLRSQREYDSRVGSLSRSTHSMSQFSDLMVLILSECQKACRERERVRKGGLLIAKKARVDATHAEAI